jgi:hemoglobin-like flavoprotein
VAGAALARPTEAKGQWHPDYKVLEEHYDIVAAALLWSLEQRLDNVFTLEVEEVWTAAYNIVNEVMVAAAYATAD